MLPGFLHAVRFSVSESDLNNFPVQDIKYLNIGMEEEPWSLLTPRWSCFFQNYTETSLFLICNSGHGLVCAKAGNSFCSGLGVDFKKKFHFEKIVLNKRLSSLGFYLYSTLNTAPHLAMHW